jgi:predicted MFS family arabinose efflux permease
MDADKQSSIAAADKAPVDQGADPNDAPTNKAYVLFVLILVYTFNFIDRQIIGILAGPIKAELNLDDTQLGLMGGLAFALFYTALGVPIAWLADRRNRVAIVSISLAVWSAFTAVCGLAGNFWQLFLARVGVGVGEAGGVAPSYSLIADYFPPQERARALAAFSFGIPIGSALGVLFGGLIAAHIDWRWAFIIVGFAGLLLAPLMWFTVKEPVRGRYDPKTATPQPAPAIGAVLKELAAKPSFWLLSFGASASSIMGYGLIFWLPSFFERSFGLSLESRAWYYAAIIFFGGVAGIWLGGWLADKLGQAKRSRYALVPAGAFILAAPAYAIGVMTNDLVIGFVLFLIPQALSLVWIGPVVAGVQGLVQPRARAVASALFLFINNLIGIGLGTLLMGRISDALRAVYGNESLRMAIFYCTGFYVLAAVLMLLASRYLDRDWAKA